MESSKLYFSPAVLSYPLGENTMVWVGTLCILSAKHIGMLL